MADGSLGPKTVAALLLAAGAGERLGAAVPKAFAGLAGVSLLVRSLRTLRSSLAVDPIVIVVPEGWQSEALRLMADSGITGEVGIVTGGSTRRDSVARGLEALRSDLEAILCHDAARPLASVGLVDRVTERLWASRHSPAGGGEEADGVVPIVPSRDTIKRVRGGWVVETIPREELGLVQTPQAFRAEALREAHSRAPTGEAASDDAVLLEAAGFRVAVVEGERYNLKVTTEEDLRMAELLLATGGGVLRGGRS